MAIPTQITVGVDLPAWETRLLALDAVLEARRLAPKLSGASAARIMPIWGNGWYGLRWVHARIWYQEIGIRPFTMSKLKGKTIPMWIDDPTGKERRDNPKAKTRVTRSGKTQVLIFRKATRPGAPGRIGHREAGRPDTRSGRRGGAIASPNVGVKWRHPGLEGRFFLHEGINRAAMRRGITEVSDVKVA